MSHLTAYHELWKFVNERIEDGSLKLTAAQAEWFYCGQSKAAWDELRESAKARCDNADRTCLRTPTWACDCARCSSEPTISCKFFACLEHIEEAKVRHERIYPNYRPSFIPRVKP